MYNLRIEHKVSDYNTWKNAFESDPVGRKKMGVRHYQISRPVDDDKYVIVDLEFDTVEKVKTFLDAIQIVWGNVAGKIIVDPKTRITELMETKFY